MREAVAAPILLVDDREENLVTLEAVLEPLGHPLVRATSGDEALRQLLEREFAVILMDVQMPGLSGIETAELIRQRPRCQHIPILFITALSRETQYVMNAYKTGAVDYLLKPIDPDILRAKVSSFVELYVRGELLRRREVQLAEQRRAEADARRVAEFEEQLIGIVGHDLRGPLTAISASAQLGLRDPAVSSAQQKHLERIQRGTQRMQHIVNTLLDFTRARVGGGIPVDRQPRDLVELAQAVADEFGAAHPEVSLTFHASAPRVNSCVDGGKLGQVLWNLLDNAAQHGLKDAPIRLAIGVEDERAVLEVRNVGKPIPEELRGALFEPYRRAPSTSDKPYRDGLGLGLYIVSQLVKAHGGSIDVESDEGAGTAFRVRLPMAMDADGKCSSVEAAVSSS